MYVHVHVHTISHFVHMCVHTILRFVVHVHTICVLCMCVCMLSRVLCMCAYTLSCVLCMCVCTCFVRMRVHTTCILYFVHVRAHTLLCFVHGRVHTVSRFVHVCTARRKNAPVLFYCPFQAVPFFFLFFCFISCSVTFSSICLIQGVKICTCAETTCSMAKSHGRARESWRHGLQWLYTWNRGLCSSTSRLHVCQRSLLQGISTSRSGIARFIMRYKATGSFDRCSGRSPPTNITEEMKLDRRNTTMKRQCKNMCHSRCLLFLLSEHGPPLWKGAQMDSS